MKLRTPFLALVIAATGATGEFLVSAARAEIRAGTDSVNEVALAQLNIGTLYLWDVTRGPYYSSSYPDPTPIFGPPLPPFYGTAESVVSTTNTGLFRLFPANNGNLSVLIQSFTAPLNLNELVDANQTFITGNAEIIGGETKRFGYSVIMPESPSPLYGWVELDGSASTIGNLVVNATWAYDTTGAPITVGTVPEPTTLTLVGLGCLALLARYRFGRKQS